MTDLVKHYRQLLGIAKTWALANIPGWCDETHRDLLTRFGACEMDGRISASTMNLAQMGQALEDYERRGWPRQNKFVPGQRGQRQQEKAKDVPPRIAHIVRLWSKLGSAGRVENANRQALLAWCTRQVSRQVPDLDHLTPAECQKLTEAMKAWLNR